MESIYFLIPLALFLLVLGIAAFLWAVNSGQFDDLDREAYRILFDEDKAPADKNKPDKIENSNPTQLH